MQTIAAMDSAVTRYCSPIHPSRTKIRHVNSRVAIVIPEIGFDDDPISPVIRELTVTKRNPKSRIIAAPATRPATLVGIRSDVAMTVTSKSEPAPTTQAGRSRWVRPSPPF